MTPTPNTSGAAGNIWCIQVMAPTARMKAEIGADSRPRARIDQMVVVVVCVGLGHRRLR